MARRVVHLFLHVCQIDFYQLVQAVEERAGLLLGDGQRLAVGCGRGGGRRRAVHGGVAVGAAMAGWALGASQDRVAVELVLMSRSAVSMLLTCAASFGSGPAISSWPRRMHWMRVNERAIRGLQKCRDAHFPIRRVPYHLF
jgi:hypothetical protein